MLSKRKEKRRLRRMRITKDQREEMRREGSKAKRKGKAQPREGEVLSISEKIRRLEALFRAN